MNTNSSMQAIIPPLRPVGLNKYDAHFLKKVTKTVHNLQVAKKKDIKHRFYSLFAVFKDRYEEFTMYFSTMFSASCHITMKYNLLMCHPSQTLDRIREFIEGSASLVNLEREAVKKVDEINLQFQYVVKTMAELYSTNYLDAGEISHYHAILNIMTQIDSHLKHFFTLYSPMYIAIQTLEREVAKHVVTSK